MSRKLAIVGSSPTANETPFDDESWEVWGLAWRRYPRVNRLFEIHDLSWFTGHCPPDYRATLAGLHIPIYLRAPLDDVPNARLFPFAEITADISPNGEVDLWTSSISHMLALAVHEMSADPANSELAVYGVDLFDSSEYAYQRPTCEYLIALARGRGIKVTLPKTTSLCRANFTYGLPPGAGGLQRAVGVTPEIVRVRLAEYAAKRKIFTDELNTAIAKLNTLDGAETEAKAMLEFVEHFNRGGVIP